MLLGFISLLITFGQQHIAKICIPEKAGNIMLPCKKEYYPKEEDNGKEENGDGDRRKLLGYAGDVVWRRVLAPAGGGSDHCSEHVGEIIYIRISF